jgi:hypothetical protein
MISDRRDSPRVRIVNQQHAALLTRFGELPVLILDRSAGGYCVLASELISLAPNARAILRDDGVPHAVRITYVRQAGVQVRVGLERVGDDGAASVANPARRRLRFLAIAAAGAALVLLLVLMLAGRWS